MTDEVIKKIKESITELNAEYMKYHNWEQGTKIMINSFYGGLANPYMYFFDPCLAECITKQGKNATDHLNTAPFYTMLKDFCTLDEEGGMYYAYDDDGAEKFRMTKPEMDFIEEDTLELYVTFTMYVPIRFAGHTVTTAEVPVKVTSALNSKN